MKKPADPLAEVDGGGGGGINPPPAPPKAPAPGKEVGGKDYADEKTPKAKRGFNYSVGSVPIPLCPLGWSDFWKDKIQNKYFILLMLKIKRNSHFFL